MDRIFFGLLLALAATAVAADCKQDCREAYKACSQAATSLDDTMRCKQQYRDCATACDAAGVATAGIASDRVPGMDCDAEPVGGSATPAASPAATPAP